MRSAVTQVDRLGFGPWRNLNRPTDRALALPFAVLDAVHPIGWYGARSAPVGLRRYALLLARLTRSVSPRCTPAVAKQRYKSLQHLGYAFCGISGPIERLAFLGQGYGAIEDRRASGWAPRIIQRADFNMGARVRGPLVAITLLFLLIDWSIASSGSTGEGSTSLHPSSFTAVQANLSKSAPDVNRFRARGPFRVDVHRGYKVPIPTGRSDAGPVSPIFPDKTPRNPSTQLLPADHIVTDLFMASHGERAPLVIFMHGFDGSNETHSDQAMHVATWGLHALTLRLLSDSEWGTNGRIIAKLIRFLVDHPQAMDGRIDANKIVLVGYSFGAISVSVALALEAPAIGAVLLDPAAMGDAMPEWLPRIQVPVLIVGADERLVQTRNREFYFKNMGGRVAEVSVVGATHEDAQSSAAGGLTTRQLQTNFVGVVSAAAFSLSSTRKIDEAWASFDSALREGWLFNARKR